VKDTIRLVDFEELPMYNDKDLLRRYMIDHHFHNLSKHLEQLLGDFSGQEIREALYLAEKRLERREELQKSWSDGYD
jgi:hypothetical protein